MSTTRKVYYFLVRSCIRVVLLLAFVFGSLGIIFGFYELFLSIPSFALFWGITGVYYEIARLTLYVLVLGMFLVITTRLEESESPKNEPGIIGYTIDAIQNFLFLKIVGHVPEYEIEYHNEFEQADGMPEKSNNQLRRHSDWLEKLKHDQELIPTIRKVYENAGINIMSETPFEERRPKKIDEMLRSETMAKAAVEFLESVGQLEKGGQWTHIEPKIKRKKELFDFNKVTRVHESIRAVYEKAGVLEPKTVDEMSRGPEMQKAAVGFLKSVGQIPKDDEWTPKEPKNP